MICFFELAQTSKFQISLNENTFLRELFGDEVFSYELSFCVDAAAVASSATAVVTSSGPLYTFCGLLRYGDFSATICNQNGEFYFFDDSALVSYETGIYNSCFCHRISFSATNKRFVITSNFTFLYEYLSAKTYNTDSGQLVDVEFNAATITEQYEVDRSWNNLFVVNGNNYHYFVDGVDTTQMLQELESELQQALETYIPINRRVPAQVLFFGDYQVMWGHRSIFTLIPQRNQYQFEFQALENSLVTVQREEDTNYAIAITPDAIKKLKLDNFFMVESEETYTDHRSATGSWWLSSLALYPTLYNSLFCMILSAPSGEGGVIDI